MHFNRPNRRAVVTLLGSAAVGPLLLPLPAKARRVRRIGAMFWGAGKTLRKRQTGVMAFRQGLEDLGWQAGRDLHIEFRWMRTDGDNDAQAAELRALAPDLIVSEGAAATSILQRQTSAIPILFVRVPDPVGGGFVASLNRPGSNITGFTGHEPSIGSKWLGLLKEAAPGVNRVVVLADRFGAQGSATLHRMQAMAPSFGMQLTVAPVKNAAEIERAIDALARAPNPGLIVLPSPDTVADHMQIVHLAAEYQVPAVYPHRQFVAGGGAMSYGIDTVWSAPLGVDRIRRRF
jgi:putative ABC transport system substrate-binding protein